MRFPSMGLPPNHPGDISIFHYKLHPALGVAPWLRKPPYVSILFTPPDAFWCSKVSSFKKTTFQIIWWLPVGRTSPHVWRHPSHNGSNTHFPSFSHKFVNGIYANIGVILMVHVTIYSIHGSYGYLPISHILGEIHLGRLRSPASRGRMPCLADWCRPRNVGTTLREFMENCRNGTSKMILHDLTLGIDKPWLPPKVKIYKVEAGLSLSRVDIPKMTPPIQSFLWDCRARWTFGIVIQHHQTIGELFSTTILKGVLIPEKKYFPNPLVQNNRVLTNENQQIKTNLVQCMNSSIIRFNLDFKYL